MDSNNNSNYPYNIMNTFIKLISRGSKFLLLLPLSTYSISAKSTPTPHDTIQARPDHVNNAESRYFPAVFNQDGGSCGSASRIGYMFTHEINAFRGTDASKPENIYPTHFTWLLTNSHSGKEGMAKANGVPNSVVYGGTTYSKLFGNQDCADQDFGWMQGYDKWYHAMFNRIAYNSFSPYGVDTEKGREFVKNWLWNHQGDADFHIGGIAGIGVASACKQGSIANDPEGRNAAAGVVGQKYVTRWGDGVDHALTIVGYDDRIVFDLDSNKVYGEVDKDEVGAWIIVNSWGNGWANKGFIYCPYKYGFPVRQHEGGAWKPEFYHVRKNYRPLRTLKVNMDYSRRSELKLLVGISTDLNATQPDISIELEHFKFAGDGRSDREKQGLESRTPMLGKWADGKLHTEPMEFGYDLTDLSSGFDTRKPLKYFFIIESRPEGIGTGRLYNCSVLDYEFDTLGIETPFHTGNGIRIKNHGQRTIISTVVQGEPFFAPFNLQCKDGNTLVWNKPQPSHYQLNAYIVYRDNMPCDTISPRHLSYKCRDEEASYSIAALYLRSDSTCILSSRTPAVQPDVKETDQTFQALSLNNGGMIIPDVFQSQQKKVTIEYWLKPRSWQSWNQAIGPGWGDFLIHANDGGALTVGWDGDNRLDINTPGGLIQTGEWHHFAFVVNNDTLTAYVNGRQVGMLISKNRSGLGSFGDLSFGNSESGAIDGELAEVRIWKEARTETQIREAMNHRFEAMGIPTSLLAYYKGEMIPGKRKRDRWRDFAQTRHARFARFGTHAPGSDMPPIQGTSGKASINLIFPDGPIYAGQTFQAQALCSPGIVSLTWKSGNTEAIQLQSPSFYFTEPGKQKITVTGRTKDGHIAIAEKEVNVLPNELSAEFQPIQTEGTAGERISFHPVKPVPGYNYEWTLKGADHEKASTQSAAATYYKAGNYRVKLRVTDLKGKTRTESYKLHVKNVAPLIQFDISPMVIMKGEKVTLTDRSRYAPQEWNWQLDSRRYTLFANGHKPSLQMDIPGVYDVTLKAANEVGSNTVTQKQAIIVCNADSKNGLNFSNEQASIQTKSPLWEGETTQMTIEWWMHPTAKDKTAGIGHSAATWQLTANESGNLTWTIDSIQTASGRGFIIPNQWHHYAVSFDNGKIRFLRDGELFSTAQAQNKKRAVKQLPATNFLRIGGEQTPMNAVIDELRIWKSLLPDTVLQRYCNAPIEAIGQAENEYALTLYYSFNQNGGDVQDLTSHRNNGTRTHFGPDGDAWGRSAGVFCLNFETPFTDLSQHMLPPSSAPFQTTGKSVNVKDAKRFQEFASGHTADGWHVENAVSNDSITTGIYVDGNKEGALCVYTRWDGFAPRLENHKLYCTAKLPAGKYELEIIPLDGQISGGQSRLAVARGKGGLPDADHMDETLASAPLSERRLPFMLDKEEEVSLGIVFNLQGNAGIAIKRIILHRATVEQ